MLPKHIKDDLAFLVQSITWSLGTLLDEESKKPFSEKLLDLYKNCVLTNPTLKDAYTDITEGLNVF